MKKIITLLLFIFLSSNTVLFSQNETANQDLSEIELKIQNTLRKKVDLIGGFQKEINNEIWSYVSTYRDDKRNKYYMYVLTLNYQENKVTEIVMSNFKKVSRMKKIDIQDSKYKSLIKWMEKEADKIKNILHKNELLNLDNINVTIEN